jgi:uncharacterized membrane protein YidH (DUF202 family)
MRFGSAGSADSGNSADGDNPTEVYDLASQLERTAMAWQRTALALGLNGALLLRYAVTEQLYLWPAGAVVLLAAAALWLAAARSYARHRGRRAGHVLIGRRVGLGTTAGLIIVSALSCYAVLLSL